MKRLVLVNGSLRGKNSSSLALLDKLSGLVDQSGLQVTTVTVKASAREPYPPEELEAVASADAMVLCFPLFSYSLPGALTRLLEDYASHIAREPHAPVHTRVYGIVNSGFPDPCVAGEAVRVVRNFCVQMKLAYRFSIAIGTGPVTVLTMKVPLLNPRLKKALREIARDVESKDLGPLEDVWITPLVPKPILLRIKEHYERKSTTLWSRPDGPVSP